jgi:hypothetical protein
MGCSPPSSYETMDENEAGSCDTAACMLYPYLPDRTSVLRVCSLIT